MLGEERAPPTLTELLKEVSLARTKGTPPSQRKSLILEQLDGLESLPAGCDNTQTPHTPDEKKEFFSKPLVGEAGAVVPAELGDNA